MINPGQPLENGLQRLDDELLDLFGIPRALLPQVVASSGIAGHTDPALFGEPIPIAGTACEFIGRQTKKMKTSL